MADRDIEQAADWAATKDAASEQEPLLAPSDGKLPTSETEKEDHDRSP
jgi:hypothetical protein